MNRLGASRKRVVKEWAGPRSVVLIRLRWVVEKEVVDSDRSGSLRLGGPMGGFI